VQLIFIFVYKILGFSVEVKGPTPPQLPFPEKPPPPNSRFVSFPVFKKTRLLPRQRGKERDEAAAGVASKAAASSAAAAAAAHRAQERRRHIEHRSGRGGGILVSSALAGEY